MVIDTTEECRQMLVELLLKQKEEARERGNVEEARDFSKRPSHGARSCAPHKHQDLLLLTCQRKKQHTSHAFKYLLPTTC